MIRTKVGRAVTILICLLVTGLFALVCANYQHDIHQARERILAGSKIVETPCGPIEYAVAGDGPPVLVVHGAGGGYDQSMDTSKALVQSGFRVIAMSRFGYLRTPLPADASAVAQADAHTYLIDALNVRRASVVGVSAGAPSSMQLALRHPERTAALALLVPAVYVPRPRGMPPMLTAPRTEFLFDTALQPDILFWAAPRLARQTVIRAILATPPAVVENSSADERERVAQVLDHILPVRPRRLGLLNDTSVTATLTLYELERIAVPTLILSMADDLFGTFEAARYSAEHIPHARFIGYPSGGHLWVGHHKEVVSEIVAFLKK
jgi:pimeloyl-ACP methyl ester carboxylesterase